MFAIRRLATNIAKIGRSKHTLPELPYKYEALEPTISRDIMMIHHQKHHQTYIANLNAAEQQMKGLICDGKVEDQIKLCKAINFNGGGHINHSIFWKNLTPDCTEPSLQLKNAITDSFGTMDKMKDLLVASSVGVQGSGWGWLGYDTVNQRLKIATTANQDPLMVVHGLYPLLGIDVWEHAYYLQYKNVRADYVKAIFDIINWTDVSERFKNAKCM